MKMEVHTKQSVYSVIIERGSLHKAKKLIGKCGIPYIITDDGVPEKWINILMKQYPNAPVFIFKNGENSKNMSVFMEILEDMLKHHVSRNDIVIAIGGGVVGDMAGFAAATYMRGISYVNIPTTTVSQIDSSIGGKTAIDLANIKNIVGAFWQPKMVIVDPDILSTLPLRHVHNGLAEAVKAGLIRDADLFKLFEEENYLDYIEEIIERSLIVKKNIVEQDERELGLRKLLNFGHTYGHAYESYYGLEEYIHGECIAMGMMTIVKDVEIKNRLEKVLKRLKLPVSCDADPKMIVEKIANDKKNNHDKIAVVQVDFIGKAHIEEWDTRNIYYQLYNNNDENI